MDLDQMISQIDGWISGDEAYLLYQLAQKCVGKGVIVEIGSWKGRSTVCLGLGSQHGSLVKVYAIDPHIGNPEHQQRYGKVWTFDEFTANLAKANVEEIVTPLVMTSEAAARDFTEPVELLFIDGAHDYASVKKDFELWVPKVLSGGTILIHDANTWGGPMQVVQENINNTAFFSNISSVDSMVHATKL